MSRISPHTEQGATRLLRAEEVADRLGVKISTLATWRCAGTGLPFVKIGGAVRYAEADVEAFIAAGRRAPAQAA